jgi:hypothetical protein
MVGAQMKPSYLGLAIALGGALILHTCAAWGRCIFILLRGS